MEDPITEIQATEPWRLRLQQAEYFLSQYRKCARAQAPSLRPDYFGMLANIDAFLFALVSVPDLKWGSERIPAPVRDAGWFALMKALRNIAAHHGVATVVQARDVTIGGDLGVAYQIRVLPDRVRVQLTELARMYSPNAKKLVPAACAHLAQLEHDDADLSLDPLMSDALRRMTPP